MSELSWYKNYDKLLIKGHGLGHKRDLVRRLDRFRIPVAALSFTVNKRLELPYQYIPLYDQGSEGSCVGFGLSWAMSILNKRYYAARKLYLEAQFHDSWSDTPPEEGTSVTAGGIVLRDQGHWRFARGITFPLAAAEGIQDFRMISTVDEVRYAINSDIPVVFGINWYSAFDQPLWVDIGKGGKRWWIGLDTNSLGYIRGGHAICCFGARDDIEAVALVNNWGHDYPIVYMPYKTLERVLREDAECLMPIDR